MSCPLTDRFAFVGDEDLGSIGRELDGVGMVPHRDGMKDRLCHWIKENGPTRIRACILRDERCDAESASERIRGDAAHRAELQSGNVAQIDASGIAQLPRIRELNQFHATSVGVV